MGLIRYPGGKTKLLKPILNKILSVRTDETTYFEPFFGGGSVGLSAMKKIPFDKVWINDIDTGMCCLWTSVIRFPSELKELVQQFKPSVDAFYSLKAEMCSELLNWDDASIVNYGLKKLALHRISYSGLGLKAGGPQGGLEQKSKYHIACRWNPDKICKCIDDAHSTFARFESYCTSLDFESPLLKDLTYSSALVYLDPPYYQKGHELYHFAFTEEDHIRLAKMLRNTHHNWVLSYDNCDEIRSLYDWATIEVVDVKYSITAEKKEDGLKSKVASELIITR